MYKKNSLKCLIIFLVVKSVCLWAVKAYPLVFTFSLFLPLQTYYNHHILALLQALVTSRTSPALEQLGEEDSRLSRSLGNMVQNPYQVRCKLALLPLSERWLSGILVSHGMDLGCRDQAFIPTASRTERLVVITWSFVSYSWRSLCSSSYILRRLKTSDGFILDSNLLGGDQSFCFLSFLPNTMRLKVENREGSWLSVSAGLSCPVWSLWGKSGFASFIAGGFLWRHLLQSIRHIWNTLLWPLPADGGAQSI